MLTSCYHHRNGFPRSFNVQVYGSPNKSNMSGKAKHTFISYPNIYFSVYNFDEIFNGIVLTDNEMVCHLCNFDQAMIILKQRALSIYLYTIIPSERVYDAYFCLQFSIELF